MKHFITLGGLLAAFTLVKSSVLPTSHSGDNSDTPLPLIIWHGLGDNYAADGIASVAELAEETNPGTLVYVIRLDEDANADRTATFFGNVTTQIEKVCADIAAHPILSTAPAVDALGFSQGGQFLRGYIERCNSHRFEAWLHLEVNIMEYPNFKLVELRIGLVPAQYFRDPAQYDQYLESSNFLADINNERELKNQTYKKNLEKLEQFVMYMFEDDETVIPKESGWFAEVVDTKVTPLKERAIYKEDWIGLKALDKKGALKFATTPGGHMSLSDKLLEKVFKEYYGPYGKSFGKGAETVSWQEEL